VYNTKRLAKDAARADRDGRTLEATGLWGRVVVQAESTLARHPDSKWTAETQIIQGEALVRLKDCARAAPVLEHGLSATTDPKLVERGAVLLGDCREKLGDPAGATAAYARLLNSKDPAIRSVARYRHGRALRINGDYERALNELEQSTDPRAEGERVAALAGSGQIDQALAGADSLLAARDTNAPWDAIIGEVGRSNPETASLLTARALAELPLSPEESAVLLRDDGQRWVATDTGRAFARLEEAASVKGRAPTGQEARLELIRLRLAGWNERTPVEDQVNALHDMTSDPGLMAARAGHLLEAVRLVVGARDSTYMESPQGDMRLFIGAELARDSLRAMPLAGTLFRRIPAGWPSSPYAPKAILALARLEPEAAESLWQVLTDGYPESPYMAVMRGETPPDLRRLEDSLRIFARAGGVPVRGPGTPTPKPQPTQVPRKPVDQ
jgi:tetratricopeptide (TPR) repeat protein